MKFVVATHGHCFDGLASAVLFTRLAERLGRSQGAAPLEASYRACGYGNGQARADERMLTGDDNAILDYRYHPSDKLTWYFDHHRTAFANDADRAHFEARRDNGRFFFDDACSSCTKLIANLSRERFGVESPDLDELVTWADRIDAARFESAEQAVDRTDPIMRLVSVVEHYGDDAFLERFVPELLQRPLSEVAKSPEIAARYRPLGKKHDRFVERVRQSSLLQGRVVFVDLTAEVLESVGKFVTYALYPNSVYSVIVGLLKSGPKISVGYNPWSGRSLDADISSICARYGGGGHPVVGGIAFASAELERARRVAREIAEELAGA
ncbi:MAG TPA: hypothetical protein VMS65_13380 [Polyangiaceae bacterium]|nr:hypothetical protein [Polyangiaceae bacterium]